MSTAHRPMPDFTDALEQHLRQAAETLALAAPAVADGDVRRRRPSARPTPARRRLVRPLAAAGSLALVAALAVVLLVAGGSSPTVPEARGGPLVLRTPLVDLPRFARPGSSAAFVLGPGSERITRGNEIPTPAGTAYLYGNEAGLCLSAPDPSLDPPEENRGVTCSPAARTQRFGIWLKIGDGYVVAAVPAGVRDPVLRLRGSAPRELRPSDDGIVTVTTEGTGTLTFFDRDGRADVLELGPVVVPDGPTIRGTPIDPDDVPRPERGTPQPGGPLGRP